MDIVEEQFRDDSAKNKNDAGVPMSFTNTNSDGGEIAESDCEI